MNISYTLPGCEAGCAPGVSPLGGLTSIGDYLDELEAGLWEQNEQLLIQIAVALAGLYAAWGQDRTQTRAAIVRSCVLSDYWRLCLDRKARVHTGAYSPLALRLWTLARAKPVLAQQPA